MSDLRKYIESREGRDSQFKALRKESQAEFEISLQIARLRAKRQVTQKELADMLGTKQSAISRIERGDTNTTVDMLERVAAALNSRLQVSFVTEDEKECYDTVTA